jgi:hypothetical protein
MKRYYAQYTIKRNGPNAAQMPEPDYIGEWTEDCNLGNTWTITVGERNGTFQAIGPDTRKRATYCTLLSVFTHQDRPVWWTLS